MEKVSACPCGSLAVGVKLYAEPTVAEVAGVPLIVGGPSPVDAETIMVKAASEAVAVPLSTLMTMLVKLPTSAAAGVPESSPVTLLKFAHEGWFWTEKVRASPFGSLAVGVKLYAAPTLTDVAGVPLIAGAPATGSAVTVKVKIGNETVAVPLLTLIMMLAKLPTFEAVGVPES